MRLTVSALKEATGNHPVALALDGGEKVSVDLDTGVIFDLAGRRVAELKPEALKAVLRSFGAKMGLVRRDPPKAGTAFAEYSAYGTYMVFVTMDDGTTHLAVEETSRQRTMDLVKALNKLRGSRSGTKLARWLLEVQE